MINRGLLLLVRLNLRGTLRAAWRRVRTLKGALTALALAPLMALMIGSQLYMAFWAPATERFARAAPADALQFLPPVAMLLLFMEAWMGRALAFRPQELDFLFPAPLSRRELLAYHLLSRLPVRVLSALWFSVFTLTLAPTTLGGVVGPVLLFCLIHVAVELIALVAAATSAWAGAWSSRLGWGLLGGVVLWSVAAGSAAAAPADRLRAAFGTPALRLLALPLQPFARTYAAESAGGLLLWGLVSAGVLAAVTAGIFALDVAYNERALASSRRALDRLRRAGGGQAAGVSRPWKLRLRLPLPGWLGPGGALAWRQSLELARNPRALALPFVVPAIYVAIFLALPRLEGAPVTREVAATAVALAIAVPLLMPNVGFDFRRDMDRMALLRSLPAGPTAVAAGQIFAPTVTFLAAQLAVVAAVSGLTGAIPGWWVAAAVALGGPLTWAVVALDNLLFLWMPYRFSPDGTQNVQFAGKAMIALALKVVAAGVLGSVALLAAWGAFRVSGGSAAAGVAGAALALTVQCLPVTWAVGAAFAGFDLTTDVPA